MPLFTTALAGLLFGLGLIVSGMVDPSKVQGFLDVTGPWDPSLAFVMGGAIGVGIVAFTLAGWRTRALLGEPMGMPPTRRIDHRLLLGSVAFGAGWGLAGFCPGPAIVAIGLGEVKAVVFGAAMLAGMGLFEWLERGKPPTVADPG